MSRKAEALAIRDAALAVVRSRGQAQTTRGKTPVTITLVKTEGLRIVHNTPFTAPPAPTV